MGLKGVEDMAS
jgi:hypothetical protein